MGLQLRGGSSHGRGNDRYGTSGQQQTGQMYNGQLQGEDEFVKLDAERKAQEKNMDQNKLKKVPGNTITRDVKDLAAPTGNIYESVVIMYKRANQIAAAEKKELDKNEYNYQ